MVLSITLENADKLLATFAKAPAIAMEEYGKSLLAIALKVVSEAQHNSPVGKYMGGGNLRQSIKYRPYGTGYVVWVNAQYGVFVDQGTKPHVILPRIKKVLAFQKDGRWIFAKRVNHPGTKATYFFTKAVEAGQTFGNAEMTSAMERVLNRIT